MAVHSAQRKFSGGAAAAASYYKQEASEGIKAFEGYYGTQGDQVLFDHVRGSAARHLEGLELSIGLTQAQQEELHNGRWNGEQLVDGGYKPVQATDDAGKLLWEIDQDNPKKRTPVYEMEPARNRHGNPITDKVTGQPKMKRKMVAESVSGYDVRFACDKSVAEYMVAHPDMIPAVAQAFRESVDEALYWTEKNAKLVVRTEGGKKHKETAELVWFGTLGFGARPTPEAIARGYETDPHLHAHDFLFAAARTQDGQWRKIDGRALYQTAKLRAQVASTGFNRRLEALGIRIAYSEADRKGFIYSEIEGSSADVRQFYSTNTQRLRKLTLDFERQYDRPPTHEELDAIASATKMRKSKVAKAADEVGNLSHISKLRQAAEDAGLRITMPGPGAPVQRPRPVDTMEALWERLDAPTGIAQALVPGPAVFSADAILPAVYRCAEGLGLTPEQMEMTAGIYRDFKLIEAHHPDRPGETFYTTQAILDAERDVAERFELKAAERGKWLSELDVVRAVRAQDKGLTAEQENLVRACCGEERMVHVRAPAGAGKSLSCQAIVRAHRAAGAVNEVVVVTESRKLANKLGSDLSADKAWSVEALKLAAERGWKPSAKTLVILDEAEMVNTFDMAEVLKTIGPAKLIDIGDAKQAKAIGAGGFWTEELKERPAVELTQVWRQSNWRDRRDLALLREGDAHQAIENLAERGRIHAADDHGELVKLVRDRYEHWREQGYGPTDIAFLNSGSNHTLDEYNRAIQRSRLDAGEISELATFQVTEKTSGRWWTLHDHERVIFNAGVYKGLDTPILNGTTGEVIRLDPDGSCRLRLDGPERREVTVKLSAEADIQPIAPAYCLSVSKFQGDQVRACGVLPGSPEIASLNSGYSAMSRATEVAEVYLNRSVWGKFPAQGLAEAWSNEARQELASQYLSFEADKAEAVDLEETLAEELTPSDDVVEKINEARRSMGYYEMDRGLHI